MSLQLTVTAADLVDQGASSQVFRARRGGRDVAIKVARSSADDAVLLGEARALSVQVHAALPRLREVLRVGAGLLEGRVALVMDWIDGLPLARASSVDVRALAVELATALECLEAAGYAHGDVKPGNVLVGARGAVLVDLGMATASASRTLRSGTPRYLSASPDLEDAGQRDRFALGLVLAEALSPAVARSARPAEAARVLEGEPWLCALVRGLISEDPRARPTPRSLARFLGRGHAATSPHVEARYLLTRHAEIVQLATHASVELAAGLPASLVRAIELSAAVAALEGAPKRVEPASAFALDDAGRTRWLASLVGPLAADWPVGLLSGVDDASLVSRLMQLAGTVPPEGWTFELVLGAARGGALARPPVRAFTPVELALALSSPRPDGRALSAAVEGFASWPASLQVAIVDALRRAGRADVALALASDDDPPEVRGAFAEAARRAGSLSVAERLARAANDDPRARATLLRLRVDRGEALDPRELEPLTPAVAEAFSLDALGRGERRDARSIAERGLAAATGDEDRARLLGLLAYVDHADGRPDDARARFVEAARSAARAGAVSEEATYLTGVAAAAVDAGALVVGAAASRRAAALFEAIDRSADAARATLSEASALAIVGATRESRALARDAIGLAERGGDVRAATLARLTLADAGDATELGRAAADARGDDRLRVASRALVFGISVDVDACEAWLVDASPVSRLEWSIARMRADLAVDLADVERALAAGPLPARFQTAELAFGLAQRRGARDVARRMGLLARELGAKLVEGSAPDHRAALLQRLEAAAVPTLSTEDPRRSQAKLGEALALVRALSSRERIGPLFSQILDALLLWTGAERGVFLAPAPDGRLVPRVARNLSLDELRRGALTLSRSAAQRAIDERRPVALVDTGHHGDVSASVHALKLLRVLAVPLLARGRVLGVVYLDDRLRPQAFGPEDLAWVELLAGIAAAAVGDAFDQVLLRRSTRKAERANARLSALVAERDETLAAIESAMPPSKRARRHHAIVGSSDALTRALELCDRVASRDLPVLITGESGSGKELFARALHDASRRRAGRFVSENCAAIPEGLLESTLFGHVRGAFTGAVTPQPGLFVIADGGTLLLDEVGEMSLAMQAKLLRVLADGEVRAVGGASTRKVDVRLIAATHRDLTALVKEGKFREDLFYRLRVVELRVPALRERSSDLPLLVAHFLKKHDLAGYTLTRAAMERLARCSWPGNVRQLENEIRRASVLSDGVIDVAHLSPELLDAKAEPETGSLRDRMDALSRKMVIDALGRHPSKTAAAEELGLSRFGLLKMMKRLQIDG